LFGPIASDPTVSRLVKTIAEAGPRALRAIREARAAARARAWALAGEGAPGAGGALIPLDLDATIVIAHSDKEQAATWKHTYGFHPMTAFIDHGSVPRSGPSRRRRGRSPTTPAGEYVTERGSPS
jgi:Transposase DDE domain group 1